MSVPGFSVRRAVTISMLFILITGFGIYNYFTLKLELYPDIEFPAVAIMTTYVGAGPEDVEQLVSKPIEEAVASVQGITEIHSTSANSSSIVIARFEWGSDMDEAEREVTKNIDLFAKPILPEDVSDPIAFAFDPSMQPIIFFSITGSMPPEEIRRISEEIIEPRLERVEGVAAADTVGGLKREIHVFMHPERMRALGVSATGLVQSLALANQQIPGGSINDGSKDYNILTEGQFQNIDEIKEVIVGQRKGHVLTVKDVATVEDGYLETTEIARNMGNDSVLLLLRRQSDANTVVTANAVFAALEDIKKDLPPDMKLVTIFDQSEIVKLSLGNLGNTAWQALLIAIIVLLFFLGSIRSAAVVGLSIPVSLLTTFAVMGQAGISLNMISMAGLALAIGMLVDNSIVVTENIFRHHTKLGKGPKEAAIDGTKEVYMAVTASTLTTLVVFAPILFVPGIAGQMFKDMSLTISVSLIASLFVAVTLIPMLTSRLLSKKEKNVNNQKGLRGILNKTTQATEHMAEWYSKILEKSLHHRKTIIGSAIGIFILSIIGAATVLDIDFMASQDDGYVQMAVSVQPGTTLNDFDHIIKKIEHEVFEEVPEARSVSVRFGETSGWGSLGGQTASSGTVQIKLPKRKERTRSKSDIELTLKERLKNIAGVDIRQKRQNMMGSEGDVIIRIFSDDIEEMRTIALGLLKEVENVEGVQNAKFSLEYGRPQFYVKMDRNRLRALGLIPAEVAGSVSAYFMGTKAGVYRDKGDEFDILVRADKDARKNARLLHDMPLVTPAGKVIPLSSVAKIIEDIGPTDISRFNQKRLGNISITKMPSYALGPLSKKIEKIVKDTDKPAGVSIEIAGAAADMQESFMYLGLALFISIFLVYMVMASQFESLMEPFVILFSIPLVLIGVVLALSLTRTTMQVTAMIGVIILVGIVVNNAIVLIDYIKQLREQGQDIIDAAVQAGRARMRPILMTAATTILAMTPLAIELGEGSEIWSPMARSVIGGLLTSSVLTLLVIPTVYVSMILWAEKRRAKKAAKQADNQLTPQVSST